MMKVFRRLAVASTLGALVLLAALPAFSQDTPAPQTPLDRQLAKVDLGVSAAGEFTSNTSGTGQTGLAVANTPSSTVGYLISLRYIHSPFIGAEFNYERNRYEQNFVYTALVPGGTQQVILGVQTNATEYSFGYVVHTPNLYHGVQPFASVGAGSIAFRPTSGGGQGNTNQARAAYYYNVGAETLVYGPHYGLRASFRQVFSLTPDFQQTYLRDHQRQTTTEPTIGIFVRF